MSLNIEEIIKLVEEKVPYDKIGQKYGVCGAYIRKVLKKQGFELPKRRKINPKETFNRGKKKEKEVKEKQPNGKFCVFCGKPLYGRQTKYCSRKCEVKQESKEGYHTKYARKQDARGTEMKIKYIKQLGGKCSICGYKKNISALVFHHVDPSTKKFTLDARTIVRKGKASVEEEIAKCILLCHNCHHELHHPEYNDML